jgi:CrcB protein
MVVVWLGGAAGTAARYLTGQAVARVGQVPVATAAVNLAGAFLLGVLMAVLATKGPDTGAVRVVRLLVGVGFLGGFTTYSALAVETVSLLDQGLAGRALAYAVGSVALGTLAAWAGIVVATGRGSKQGRAGQRG